MAQPLWIAAAAFATILLGTSAPLAQPNSSTVDYIVISPDYACTRVSPGGIDEHTAQFTANGWNRGPNAVAEDQGGDDIPLGPVAVEWAMPDTAFDANSGENALTESPNGDYGNGWDVTARAAPSFDLTSAASASLEFYHHYELENGFDFAYVQVNAGSGWTNLATYNGTLGSFGVFQPVSLNLASYLGQTIQIRFRVDTDFSVTRDGWVVDDVIVRVDGTPVFSDDLESGLGNWVISAQWGLTVPGGLAGLGTITANGIFKSGGITGTTFVRAIYDGTIEDQATVDVYPPDWVP